MANITYIDQYIIDGKNNTFSLKNFYDSILIGDENKESIFRVPIDDFFLKHQKELESCKQPYICPETYFYKPKALSFSIYGTTELWLSILRLNGLRSTCEFNYPVIWLYEQNRCMELIKTFFKREGKY